MRGFLLGCVAGSLLTLGYQAQKTERTAMFDNDCVKVWKTVVAPGVPTELHRHDHPRVIVALTSGTMELIDQRGAKEQHVWEAGKAYWMPAMAAGTMHRDVNSGSRPLEVMTAELEKERRLKSQSRSLPIASK